MAESAAVSPRLALAKPELGTARMRRLFRTRTRLYCAMDRALFYSPQAGRRIESPRHAEARFAIGDRGEAQIVRFPRRGVRYRPGLRLTARMVRGDPQGHASQREQPFYHLLAENEDSSYVAYVSQQNLLGDSEGGPVDHPSLAQLFEDSPTALSPAPLAHPLRTPVVIASDRRSRGNPERRAQPSWIASPRSQ